MLNAEPNNLVVLKTYTTKSGITIAFTDQNGRPIEVEDKVNLALRIDK